MTDKQKIEVLVKEESSLNLNDADKLLYDLGIIYGRGMSFLESYVKNYPGSKDVKLYLSRVCDYIKNCNSNPNTRIFGLDDLTKENILKKVPLNIHDQ